MKDTTTVKDILNLKPIAEVGVEVETESSDYLPDQVKGWDVGIDGSLRGVAYEYKTSMGTKYSEVSDKIEDLFSAFNKKKSKIIEDSLRTSIHVHHNIADKTLVQLWTSVCALWLLEPGLVKVCGEEERDQNPYCFRTEHDPHQIEDAIEEVSDLSVAPFKASKFKKYSFVNLACVKSYGSLEMRGMRFTKDTELLKTWISGIKKIIDQEVFKDPKELLDVYTDVGGRALAESLLGDHRLHTLLKQQGDINSFTETGELDVSNFAYCQDWDLYSSSTKKFINKTKRPKDSMLYALDEAPAPALGIPMPILNQNAIRAGVRYHVNQAG